jgi:iron complex outermembrane receptor protein
MRKPSIPEPKIFALWFLSSVFLLAEAPLVELEEIIVTEWRNELVLPLAQIDRIFDAKDIANINTTTIDDAIRYAPGFGVRRRFIGDQNAPVYARGSNTTQSARSFVTIDGMPVSNLLGSGHGFGPRWELISPTEVASVTILNGPYTALHTGNTIAAGIFIESKPPRPGTGYLSNSFFVQEFDAFGTRGTYPGFAIDTGYDFALGEKLLFSVHASRLQNQAQPQSFDTVNLSTTTDALIDPGTPVFGAIRNTDARGIERFVFGTPGSVDTTRNLLRLRSRWQAHENAELIANIGYWQNTEETDRPETYLRTIATGAAVNEGRVNFDGRSWVLGSGNFRRDLIRREYLLSGLTLHLTGKDNLNQSITVSSMETLSNRRRQSNDLPGITAAGGNGNLIEVPDEGWLHLAYRGRLVFDEPIASLEVLHFGGSFDHMRTVDETRAVNNWRSASSGTLSARNAGKSQLGGIYIEGEGALAESWRWRFGVRAEQWRAFDGTRTQPVAGVITTDSYPNRRETAFSPRAAIIWEPTQDWEVELAAAQVSRFPTVGELFSGQLNAAGLISRADPNLKPEIMQSTKLTLSRHLEGGHMALSVFVDRETDTLYRQGDIFTGITINQNIPRVRTLGSELRYDQRGLLDGMFDFYGSIMYLDSRILSNPKQPASENRYLPRVPRWRIRALATYNITETLGWTIGVRHDGKQFNQLDNSDGGRGGLGSVDSFFLVDTRVRYQPAEHISVGIGVDNLTNKLHWVGHPYPMRTYFVDIRLLF